MTQSELNHLRRLLGWVSCEIGQEPADMVKTMEVVATAIGQQPISDEAKRRLVEGYDKAANIPKYVRAAVKALAPLVGGLGDVVDAEEAQRKLPAP